MQERNTFIRDHSVSTPNPWISKQKIVIFAQKVYKPSDRPTIGFSVAYMCMGYINEFITDRFRFTTSMITYGTLFNMDSMSGDPFLNMAYYGAMRVGANLTFIFVDTTFKYV